MDKVDYKAVHIRLTEEQYDWLRRYCFDHEVSQAEIIRQALDLFINQKEEPKNAISGEC